MKNKPAAIFFDSNDYQLLKIVQEVLEKGSRSRELRSLLVEHMHPQGIKEMAAATWLDVSPTPLPVCSAPLKKAGPVIGSRPCASSVTRFLSPLPPSIRKILQECCCRS